MVILSSKFLRLMKRPFTSPDKPTMIIAKTIKGKGVSFIEDKNGWHGKTLKKEECDRALKELGEVDKSLRGEIPKPEDLKPEERVPEASVKKMNYTGEKSVATRKAYGNATGQDISEIS